MTALQVYAILNKRVRGLISGVKSAVVNGTTITWTMNDGTKVPMTFPTPADGKDGVSVVNIEIKKKTDNKKHLIFTLSDGSAIDSGELEGNGGNIIQKDTSLQFPSSGDENTLYIAKNEKATYYWDGSKYQKVTSSETQISAKLKTASIEFDGISDTFDLPLDDIIYNVYVNGIYYTEGEDYSINRTVSPNQITFSDIYEDYELCTLTYLEAVNSSSGSGNCECEPMVYADNNDIDSMFAEGGSDGN